MNIPNFGDLLVGSRGSYDPDRVSSAAENELSALLPGLAAIGHVLWLAHAIDEGESEVGVERDQVAALGFLVQTLAFQVEAIVSLKHNVEYDKHQAELRKDKPRAVAS